MGRDLAIHPVDGNPAFAQFSRVREAIADFWADAAQRCSHIDRDHEDISDVILATSLVPSGFIVLRQAA